jgi:predicted dehydrogenase
MFRVGIIGCGKVAQTRHIPEYEANPRAEVAGYFDINAGRARGLAEAHGGKAYSSWRELLDDRGMDAVSVCTANDAHAEISIAAMKAGKHVLCEKPMAVTLPDCEAMAEASARTGMLLMIGHNQRLTKAHVLARGLLSGGLIGRILTFRTAFGHGGPETWSVDPGASTWFFDKKRAAMGAMADLGVHKTDLIHFLTGETVVEATAKLASLDKRGPDGSLIGIDDNAICVYRLSGGAIGTMTASWTHYGAEDNSTVLYGTKGIMRIYDDPEFAVTATLSGGEKVFCEAAAMQTNDLQTSTGVIDEFVACAQSGRPSGLSGAEALKAMRAVFACIQSSETGRAVAVIQ